MRPIHCIMELTECLSMFLQWGNGHGDVKAAKMDDIACPQCKDKCPASLYVRYHYGYVYFVFSAVMRFEYFHTCDICGLATKMDPAEAKPLVQKLKIPFMTRYGCLVGLAMLAACIGLLIYITNKKPAAKRLASNIAPVGAVHESISQTPLCRQRWS